MSKAKAHAGYKPITNSHEYFMFTGGIWADIQEVEKLLDRMKYHAANISDEFAKAKQEELSKKVVIKKKRRA